MKHQGWFIFVLAIMFCGALVFGSSNHSMGDDGFYVIPVKKGCTCKGTPNGARWCDNGDGTVTDLTTCLVWLKYANFGGRKRWRDSNTGDDALRVVGLLCDGAILDQSVPWDPVYLKDGSGTGEWRLPTKTELLGITTGEEFIRSWQPSGFKYVQGDFYWSSTFSSYAWVYVLSLSTGGVQTQLSCCPGLWPEYENAKAYVWPVRQGK